MQLLRRFRPQSPFLLALGLVFVALQTRSAEPPVVDPGPPPSDAVILFDGHDLSAWKNAKGAAAGWEIEDGAMVVNGTGNLVSNQEFGSCQLHLEWATPRKSGKEGQGSGNSGVYLQGRYEVQILDSYRNSTYPDGQAGAFYGNRAPLVNVSLPPEQWQRYDIIFHAPRKAPDGSVIPGSLTVLHNGVLIQDQTPVAGKHTTAAMFQGVVEKGPLVLQDHGNPVRYRNIWIRPLE